MYRRSRWSRISAHLRALIHFRALIVGSEHVHPRKNEGSKFAEHTTMHPKWLAHSASELAEHTTLHPNLRTLSPLQCHRTMQYAAYRQFCTRRRSCPVAWRLLAGAHYITEPMSTRTSTQISIWHQIITSKNSAWYGRWR